MDSDSQKVRPVKRLVEKHHHAYAGRSARTGEYDAHPMLVVVTDDTASPFVGFEMFPESVAEALSLIEKTGAVDSDPRLVILSSLVEYYELYEDGVTGPIETLVSYGVDEDGYAAHYCTRYEANEAGAEYEFYDTGALTEHDEYIEVLTRYMIDPDY